MPFHFNRHEGLLLDATGAILDPSAYSGIGEGDNNPALEVMPHCGPIPAGEYLIGPVVSLPDDKGGPLVLMLTPRRRTELHGRTADGFYVRCDNETQDRSAGAGCLVACRAARVAMRAGVGDVLTVT
jgi:hypothetical protein